MELLEKIILDGYVPDTEELRRIAEKYPYFAGADAMVLMSGSLPAGEERKECARRLACCAGDPEALRRVSGSGPDFDSFYPDMTPDTPSTDDTISKFLDTYGKEADKESDILEKVIFSGVPSFDAAFHAEKADTMPEDETSVRIESFLSGDSGDEGVKKRTRRSAAPREDAEKEKEAVAPLTESLARVMVKNGNYKKALEIISALSLDNPQKSAYFADQIRFLKKLIINQQYKN